MRGCFCWFHVSGGPRMCIVGYSWDLSIFPYSLMQWLDTRTCTLAVHNSFMMFFVLPGWCERRIIHPQVRSDLRCWPSAAKQKVDTSINSTFVFWTSQMKLDKYSKKSGDLPNFAQLSKNQRRFYVLSLLQQPQAPAGGSAIPWPHFCSTRSSSHTGHLKLPSGGGWRFFPTWSVNQ